MSRPTAKPSPVLPHLTQRELDTLTAALHCWQNELSYHSISELRAYHTELTQYVPLTIDEVDVLLARLRRRAGGES